MRTVSIQYHTVANATAELPFLVNGLKSLFTTSGINLDLVEGESIDLDPTYSALDYPYYVQKYSEVDHKYGHLIIGCVDRNRREDVNV